MRTHQHLFMLKETVKDLEEDGLLLKAAISKVPIADWVALLEAGWGAIKETRFGLAYGDKKLYIPYRILSP